MREKRIDRERERAKKDCGAVAWDEGESNRAQKDCEAVESYGRESERKREKQERKPRRTGRPLIATSYAIPTSYLATCIRILYLATVI